MFQSLEFKENMAAHTRGGLANNISNFITDSTFTGMVTTVNVIEQVLSSIQNNTLFTKSDRKVLINVLIPDTYKPGTSVVEFMKTLTSYTVNQAQTEEETDSKSKMLEFVKALNSQTVDRVHIWAQSSPVTLGLTETYDDYTDVIIVDILGYFNTEIYIDADDDLECSYYIIQKYALGMSRLTNGTFLISETSNNDKGITNTTLLMRHILVQNSDYPFIDLSEFHMFNNELEDDSDCIVSEYLLTDVEYKRKNIEALDTLLEDTEDVLFVSDSQAVYDYIKLHCENNSVVTTNAYIIMRGMVSPPDGDNWFASKVYHITDEVDVTKLPPLKHTQPTMVDCQVTSKAVESVE